MIRAIILFIAALAGPAHEKWARFDADCIAACHDLKTPGGFVTIGRWDCSCINGVATTWISERDRLPFEKQTEAQRQAVATCRQKEDKRCIPECGGLGGGLESCVMGRDRNVHSSPWTCTMPANYELCIEVRRLRIALEKSCGQIKEDSAGNKP